MKKLLSLILCLSLCICACAITACVAPPVDSDTGSTPTNTDTDSNIQNDPLASIQGNNVFVVTYENKGNGTITATVSVAGTVSYAGFTGDLKYDSNVLSVVSHNVTNGVVVGESVPGTLSFSYGAVSNVTNAGSIFTVDFSYSGNIDTLLELEVDEVANAALQDVEFSVRNVNVKIN